MKFRKRTVIVTSTVILAGCLGCLRDVSDVGQYRVLQDPSWLSWLFERRVGRRSVPCVTGPELAVLAV